MTMELQNRGERIGATRADFKTRIALSNSSPIHVRNHHHSAARMLRIALILGHHRLTEDGRLEAWCDFANVIFHRLTEEERILLSYWSLRTVNPSNRLKISQSALWGV